MNVALVSLCENSENKALYFPIGLLTISDILDDIGIINRIIDINRLERIDDFRSSILNEIQCMKYDFVGFYTRCDIFPYVLSISKEIKKVNKNVSIFLGGPEASAMPIKYLQKFDFIDMIFVGESEVTIREYFSAIAKKQKTPHIRGLAYRKGNDIIYEYRDELISNLDTLSILNYKKLIDYDMSPLPVEIGRGCPNNCIFCSTSIFWKRKYRFKSAKRIVIEIKKYIDEYNIHDFYFIHDNILAGKDNILSLCEEIMHNEIDISWECSGRIDNIDNESIALMKNAGCKSLYFGIETGSPNMQTVIGKRLDISRISSKLNIMDKYDLNCILSFIIGFPNETLEDVTQTFKVAILSKQYKCVSYVQFHHLTVNTGTKLYDENCEKLIKNKGLRNLSDQVRSATGRLFNESEQEMIERNANLFPSFHLLPFGQSSFNNLSALATHLMYIANSFPQPIFELGLHDADIYKDTIVFLAKALEGSCVVSQINHQILFQLIKKHYLNDNQNGLKDILLAVLIHERMYLRESELRSGSTDNTILLDDITYKIDMLTIISRFKYDPFMCTYPEHCVYYLFYKNGNTINHYKCSRVHSQILKEIKKGNTVEQISTKCSLPKIIVRKIVMEFVNIGVLNRNR